MKKFYLSAIVLGGMALGTTALVSASDSALTAGAPSEAAAPASGKMASAAPAKAPTGFITEIKSIKTFEGRNVVSVKWHTRGGTGEDIKPESYTLTRDGKALISHTDVISYIDSNVPDGDHVYQVTAHFKDGDIQSLERKITSFGQQPVKRDYGYDQYTLTEVYNYPILDAPTAEYPEGKCINISDASYTGTAGIANFLVAASSSGAPGDMYRVGAYRSGKWYIAQLSDNNSTQTNNKGIKYIDVTKPSNGGIIRFNADNPLEKPQKWGTGRLPATGWQTESYTMKGCTNQWICIDETDSEGNWRAYFRYNDDEQVSGWNLSSQNRQYLMANSEIRYISNWGTVNRESIKLDKEYAEWDKQWKKTNDAGAATIYWSKNGLYPDQYARVHYATANGHTRGADGGYVFFALNASNKVARVRIVQDKLVEEEIIDIPIADNPDEEIYSNISPTENYAVPVAGRPEDFIYQSRGNAYFYVTKKNGSWTATPFFSGREATTAGGITFKYNDEIFFIHPSTLTSNNTGNFRIDFPERKKIDANNKQTADQAEFSLDNMVPAASFKQKEATSFAAGNSNCMWFGVEPANDAEGGIFIYQYVPGARFAKYRFRANTNFPHVTPSLEVTITQETLGAPQSSAFSTADITDAEDYKSDYDVMNVVTAKGKWQVPANFSELQNTDWKLVGYYPRLKDEKGNTVATGARVAARDNSDNLIMSEFNIDFTPIMIDNKLVNEQVYTMELEPEYQNVNSGVKAKGEIGYSEDQDVYTPAIGDLTAIAYKDKNNDVYRVDLDFNRADMSVYPKPVDYFAVKYRKKGTDAWLDVPNLRLMYQGNIYVTQSEINTNNTHKYRFNGKDVPGIYRFGNNLEPASYNRSAGDSDKGYANVNKHGMPVDKNPRLCVASHTVYGQFNPKEYEYQVTAVYASKSPLVADGGIRKEVSAVATPGDYITTGTDDTLADGMAGLHVYPNPADNDITVEYGQAIAHISIYTLSGAVVMDICGNNDNRQTVNVSSLAPGMYMISVNNAAPQRLIKH